MAPRNWKRPLTLIYDNNYKYGSSLYSTAIDDIERRYMQSMSRTHLSSDRMDTRLSTMAGSAISLAPSPLLFDRTSSLLSGGSDLRRVRSVPDMPSYLSDHQPRFSRSRMLLADPFNLEQEARARRRRRRRLTEDEPTTSFLALPTIPELTISPSLQRQRPKSMSSLGDCSYLMDKCRHLQGELESVSHRVSEAEAKLKSDVAGSKSKIEMGLSELSMELQDSGRQNTELQKVIKRQARQMACSVAGDAVAVRRAESSHERSLRRTGHVSTTMSWTSDRTGLHSSYLGPGSPRVRPSRALYYH